MELLGYLMALIPFAALFAWVCLEAGAKVAVGVFVATALVSGWFYISVSLASGGW